MIYKFHKIIRYRQMSLLHVSIVLAAITFCGYIPPVNLSSQQSFGIELVDEYPSDALIQGDTFSEQFIQLDKITGVSNFTLVDNTALFHFNNLTNVLFKSYAQKAFRHKIVWTKLSRISFSSYTNDEPKTLIFS